MKDHPGYDLAESSAALIPHRRLDPVSDYFAFDRGTPVDRYFIERFLQQHAGDVRGRVLEVKNDACTRAFGAGRVLRSDVLDVDAANPAATIVADLQQPRPAGCRCSGNSSPRQ